MAATFELPEGYRRMSTEACKEVIRLKKEKLGRHLVILVHHYQRREIVPFHDYLGDSYALSARAAAQKDARYIVFCGVLFMAEAADILAGPQQTVYLSHPQAGCPMADMAPRQQVMGAWEDLAAIIDLDEVTPVTYMNSTAELKAFCGRHGGVICTSSNADKAFDYAFGRGARRILFLPDQHLGRNTANRKGIPKNRVLLWDPQKPLGGNGEEAVKNAAVILWKGHCHVHMNFTIDQVRDRRRENPGVRIVVHPECREEVVDAADAVGSTRFIVEYVADQPAGAAIAIGTELNLVKRLSDEYPEKTITVLSGESSPICGDMFRTTLNRLAYTLDVMESGGGSIVTVPEQVASDARLALERMLELE